jgi:hypothetical protein
LAKNLEAKVCALFAQGKITRFAPTRRSGRWQLWNLFKSEWLAPSRYGFAWRASPLG